MARTLHSTAAQPDRAYLVAADIKGTLLPAEESLAELAELARTAGAQVVGSTSQRLEHPMAATDRKSTRLNSSHIQKSRMPSSA